MEIPQTHYAKSGSHHIAYQVFGEGAFDLVLIPPFVSHLEMWWEQPLAVRALRQLASFARVIMFDKRGTGMSDRVDNVQLPTPEERIDDVRAVMESAGSTQGAILGSSEGGWMATLFAGTYPERVRALVLHAAHPRAIQDEDFPEGWLPRERMEQDLIETEQSWLSGRPVGGLATDTDERATVRAWYAKMMRLGASPGAAVALAKMDFATDIRAILPSIHVPTLVTVREGDENLPASRYMAQHIPGARFSVFPGDEHGLFFGDQDAILGEIEEFLTGVRTPPLAERVLSTVLFTDIVESTKRAAELGDRQWRDLLDEHDAMARQQLTVHRGRRVNSIGLGDGILATFDGPARAIRCAQAICEGVTALGVKARAGVHTGEVEVRGEDLAGMAVHIGARVSALAQPGEVLVSGSVPPLVAGSGLVFHDRGEHELKGVPGRWRLFAAT
ncbi:MAG: adenylate/guanylate cyclase domain-containing protein [Chloroflexi bacterium]|nr:MAG: adenylate/guanylate cyclase domain-containing protein [Chloroflexota bacterium]